MFSHSSKPYSWVPSVPNVIFFIFVCALGLTLCSWWVKKCAGWCFEILNSPFCKFFFNVDWTLPVLVTLVKLMLVCFYMPLFCFNALFYTGGGVAGVLVVVVWLLGGSDFMNSI